MKHFKQQKIMAVLGIGLAVVVLLLGILVGVLNSNLLRPTLAHVISSKTGRETAIGGDLHAKLLTWTPTLEINGLAIKNPPWADKPIMFSADKITVSVKLDRLLRGQIILPQVALVKPVINLERAKDGRASWELGTTTGTPNGNTKPAKIPTIEFLTIDSGNLHVLDQIRKLSFQGSLVAAEQASANDSSAFKIRAKGSLNEKPFSLDVDGAPLKDLTPRTAYTFTAKVTAADINLDTKVTVEKPFDLSKLDVVFVVTGKDLADGFYLTGLALPNTPPYRLAASVKVSGTTFTIDDLNGRLGSSDLSGQLVVETKSKIPKMTASLTSKTLNMVDLAPTLGAPPVNKGDSLAASTNIASQGTNKQAKPVVTAEQKLNDRLFSDAELQVNRVRGMDADVRYSAGAVNMPKVPIRHMNLHLILDNGILTIDPLSFELDQGKFSGSIRINAQNKVPQSIIDMRLEDVDLSQFKSAAMTTAPMTGSLAGRMRIEGSGDSLHRFASSAQGAVSIIIPSGEIEAGMAELTGIDVTRGLGLLIGKKEQKTAVLCSVVDFQAQQGLLAAKTFFIDTTDVLISGRGDINLQNEKLELEVKGDPKHIRFSRLRSPIELRGTLAHPAIGVDVKKLLAQAGVATALGTLLTPLAAVIAFIDPGLAKNKDCAMALSQTTEPIPVQK